MGKTAIDAYTKAQVVTLYNNSKIPLSMDEVSKQLNLVCSMLSESTKKQANLWTKSVQDSRERLGERD